MDYVGAIIGVLGTILGGVLSYAAFHRNSKKDSEEEGKSSGTMLTEIGYIKGGIDRIERKQDTQDARYISMAERMSAVESSAKTGVSFSSAGSIPPRSYHGLKKARHPIGLMTLLYFLYISAM